MDGVMKLLRCKVLCRRREPRSGSRSDPAAAPPPEPAGTAPKPRRRISFSKRAQFVFVPSRRELNESQQDRLWWDHADYRTFRESYAEYLMALETAGDPEASPTTASYLPLHLRLDSIGTAMNDLPLCFCKDDATGGFTQFQLGSLEQQQAADQRAAAEAQRGTGEGAEAAQDYMLYPFHMGLYYDDDERSDSSLAPSELEERDAEVDAVLPCAAADCGCCEGKLALFEPPLSPSLTDPLSSAGGSQCSDSGNGKAKLLRQFRAPRW